MPSSIISIGQATGPRRSSCGYCSPPGERSQADTFVQSGGLVGIQLSCDVYQRMIDRGWRRSGTWCYKPWLEKSCCPQYTIRLDATAFAPSKSQRKLITRWNRYVTEGDGSEGRGTSGPNQSAQPSKVAKPTKSGSSPADFLTSLHAVEKNSLGGSSSASTKHIFEVTLEPSSLTQEKYDLYDLYQKNIHKDKENTVSGFKRFLVTSPLASEPIAYSGSRKEHLPQEYGSYHQMYRVDGKLIAMGVLDILPSCVSSVYFVYDPAWEKHSLGKLSALREIALARKMHEAGAKDLKYLYMGFYIQSCQKMRYKGDYQPSFLADPEDYTWHPLDIVCRPLLEKHRYACFSAPERSSNAEVDDDEDLETPSTPIEVDEALLSSLQAATPPFRSPLRSPLTVLPITRTKTWRDPYERGDILHCVKGLGEEVSREIIFAVYV
ncbi:arginine-tRNA-protein transferase [Pterulicium gracile]|uniref:Arginyl-tRNA--protein transferase 1 n=1 Tax=Pterulicium gracile TaxID=1884261 RepID=A0A5C3QV66_9AGAR|nr:arginine-tRNA-protein transferase [Pterula gracilis]